jgi:type I restriction enzyme R subunit
MSKLGVEKSAVQNPLIQYACEIGWEYIKPDDAERLRGGRTGLIFKEVFTNQLIKLNTDFIDSIMIEDVINRIGRIPPRKEGNLEAWEYLKGLKTVFIPSEKRERNVKLIDEEPKNNVYQITDEFSYTNGINTNRYDVVFLINGFPILFVETKSVADFMNKIVLRESVIAKALDQIRRYHTETPEAISLFQIYSVTNIIHFLYAATWSLDIKSVFNWKTESITQTYEDLVKSFFDKQRLIQTLLHFILFTKQDDELIKVIFRPHQMRAVNKIEERARSNKKRGLIWHTQGSGKTFTMIVAAQQILANSIFNNPTVIMLVDRNELETQLFNNLVAVGYDEKRLEERVADSKEKLREMLSRDTRGLIVSMIHKFEGMPANINTRKNIFVLVDEAHRTVGGENLGTYLMGALPNATYLGFTGTPIDRTAHGKGTFITFGKDDPPHGYLDKYGIAESIEDGTTVKLHYTLAPNELRPDKETLEKEFFSLAETEGISDIEELNKVLERAVTLKNMLKNHERIVKVAKYVVEHYKDFVEPLGYKAFLVAVDREACALYKEELDKYLPKEYSEVVYSPFYDDGPGLKKYHLTKEHEKRIRKAFRDPSKLPKILIVTEKLLTGFDAPILYCMYLDKPMRDHVLLQAIARVNRPFEDNEGRKKPAGFVLDFVGIFDKLEKALSFDSSDITGVIKDIEELKQRFVQLICDARNNYLILVKDKKADKAIEAILEFFLDDDKRREFYEFFSEISDIFEILSPDAFLRPYIDDFDALARMYKIVREAYDAGISIDREFARKTAKLVQEHTYTGEIKLTSEIFEINGDTIRKLEQSSSSDMEKIFNLLRSIGITINNDVITSPYLQSIADKVEIIAELFKQRQKNTQETLRELKNRVEEINQARKEQAAKNMPPEIFTAYWILKTENVQNAEGVANQMMPIFKNYPYWNVNEEQERQVKQELLRIFTEAGTNAKKSVALTNKIITILKKAR